MTGVQINELMKLPGITSNLRGLMQCLVPMLYIIKQLAVLEKEKSLEPFNPTCNLEEKNVSMEPIIKFDSFDFERR